jgi:dihydrolipoamide dehydrogenase
MRERFDAIVIGAGLAGETCAHRLRQAGKHVALIERDHIGGASAYWAEIPSATLFGPANRRWRAQQVAGITSPSVAWPRSLVSPETLLTYLREATQIETIQREGGTFLLGEARLQGEPGVVQVGTRELEAEHIVLATGTESRLPAIDGLATAGCWTAREAATAAVVPGSLAILGGEGQAIEFAQMFRLYGANVTIITAHDRLLSAEDPEIGMLLGQHLHEQGIRVLCGHTATKVDRDQYGFYHVTLEDHSEVQGTELLVVGDHQPCTQGLGLEQTDITYGPQGIVVDAFCQASKGIWAIGAVTGQGGLSHLAQYQARIAADAILGRAHPADYRSVPRIIFTDPQVAAVGPTRTQLREQRELEVASVTVDLTTRQRDLQSKSTGPRAQFTLYADRRQGVLLGAWAVAPEAGEWIQLAMSAIHARIPMTVLLDTLEQLPVFGEAYLAALDQLLDEVTPPQVV